jgi:small conductance mechanosensitive channel
VTTPVAQEAPIDDGEQPIFRDVQSPELSELTDPSTILDLIAEAFAELAGDVLGRLPLILIAIAVFALLLLGVRLVMSGVNRGMRRADVDFTVRRLVSNLLRLALLLTVALLALSIAGVEIGAMLAALGLIGLGIALALQNILENLISGVLILIRKPYDRGEIVITAGLEGYVEDIDLRVTTIRAYDGTMTLVPNADIYRSPITNLSRRGTRRAEVPIGIDYRDDHERARELMYETVDALEEVLEDPPPVVVLTDLADSSVDFEVRVWFDVHEQSLVGMRDLVLSTCKTALEDAGMTIPWPIRTLAADMHPLQLEHHSMNGQAAPRGGDVGHGGPSGAGPPRAEPSRAEPPRVEPPRAGPPGVGPPGVGPS